MLKHKSKALATLLVVLFIVLASSFSFATENPEINSTAPGDNARVEQEATNEIVGEGETPETPETPEGEVSNQDIHDGDLYLIQDNNSKIVMDQLVDGNVFIIGKDVEITGKVNGSIYILADHVTFAEGSYIIQSIYVCANQVTYSGDANDLYAACNHLILSDSSFVIRDLRAFADTLDFASVVGRNAYISAQKFNFTSEGESAGLIYGDLTYSSKTELSLSSELVQGNTNFTPLKEKAEQSTQEIILDKIVSFLTGLAYTIVIFLFLLWATPNFTKNSGSFVSGKMLPALGIGLFVLFLAPIAAFLLILSSIGTYIALAILVIYGVLISICHALVSISITYKLKEKFELDKFYMTLLTLSGTSLVIWGLTQIPVIGGYISFFFILVGLGIPFFYGFTRKNFKAEQAEIIKEK